MRVGQKVVCVDSLRQVYNEDIPVVNEIYTIRDARDGMVRLKEIVNASFKYREGYFGECWFDEDSFRLVLEIGDAVEQYIKEQSKVIGGF